MEVKRAFRCFKGPDDPGPFSDIINSMSFGCRHMKEFNKNGVFCLTANTPEGKVKVMRVGDVDYIWTEGGIAKTIYIILIPDLVLGWKIPVTCKENDYAFLPMSDVDDLKSIITRYEFARDPNTSPRFEYTPYIARRYDISHTSVGFHGDMSSLNPYYDWHYKHYILDCTGDAGDDDIFRPPYQYTYYGFGEDLHPPWYSLSSLTAHGFHYCFEAAIDQQKRIYQPINIVVQLDSEEITISDFELSSRDGTQYNFLYKFVDNRFYGKNAFTYVLNSDGIYELTSFGESIYSGGAVSASVPEGIDPVLFFWPWVPYLDEIRSFNVLGYAANDDNPLAGRWFITPTLGSLHSWRTGGYNKLGQQTTAALFSDQATFSDVTYPTDGDTTNTPAPCSCGDCGTGTIITTNSQTTTPYGGSGTKYVPIGLIGGKIPIVMENIWSQNGTGPTRNQVDTLVIAGTYPTLTLQDPGGSTNIAELYESCCISSFASTGTTSKQYSESASNNLSLNQILKVGDDVIFSGESSLSYSMSYSLVEGYNGAVAAEVIPPFDPPVCAGHINFTTQTMGIDEQQTLSWSDTTDIVTNPCADTYERVFRWSLSGGGALSSTKTQKIIYTAPHTNPSCADNATISLYCNDVLIDTLGIGINSYTGAEYAYTFKWYEAKEGAKCNGTCSPGGGQYAAWHTYCNRYDCSGAIVSYCYEPDSMCTDTPDTCTQGCWLSTPNWCGGLFWNVNHDIRSAAMIAAGCCPGGL
jgi:hypothetical protein